MTRHIAHHFNDADQQFEAARLGMWAFLATEVLFFGGLSAGYIQYRFFYPEAWIAGSKHLDLTLGTINTAVLLLSSFTMALAVNSVQTGDGGRKASVALIVATLLLGVFFLSIKFTEYSHKFEQNLVPGLQFTSPTNINADIRGPLQLFFSFYFAMTGLHAVHMIIGLGLLGTVATMAARGQYSPEYHTPVEMAGLYWHFIDIVWVFLFPLFYLIG